MVHRRAGRQLVGQAGERRRRRPRARGVDDVVAEEAHRQHAPTSGAGHAAGGVQREHVEEHGVAGLELPSEDAELVGPSVDVGQLGERAVGEPLGLVVHERPRHVPLAAVRAGDELQRRLHRHWVDREPHAGVLPPVDVVVRLVLVPRRALARARLLDEHVVVVQPHRGGAHQLGGDGSGARLAGESFDLRDPLPVAEVLDERPVVGAAGPLGERRQVGEVGVDRLTGEVDVLGRRPRRGRRPPRRARSRPRRSPARSRVIGRRTPRSRATSVARS